MLLSPEFWVGVSFVIFVLLMIKPVKNVLLKKLDERSATIKSELNEAEDVKHQAELVLLTSQNKQKSLPDEINKIVQWAENEVDALVVVNNKSLSELLDRKNKLAQQKIETAEQDLIKNLHYDMFITVIQSVQIYLKNNVNTQQQDILFEKSIANIEPQLSLIS